MLCSAFCTCFAFAVSIDAGGISGVLAQTLLRLLLRIHPSRPLFLLLLSMMEDSTMMTLVPSHIRGLKPSFLSIRGGKTFFQMCWYLVSMLLLPFVSFRKP
jgi:hypothetical protein